MNGHSGPEQIIFLDGLARSGTSFTARLISSFPDLFFVLDGFRIATEALTDAGHLRLGVREYPEAMYDGVSIDLGHPIRNLQKTADRIRAEINRSSRNVQGALPPRIHRGLHDYLDGLPEKGDVTHRDFFQGLFGAMTAAAGTRKIGTKTTNQTPYLENILTAFPQAKWISIVRDPRGNYLSQVREHHVPVACFSYDLWNTHVRHTLDALSNPRFKGRVLLLRYEDLMLDPLGSTGRLAEFLQMNVDIAQHLKNLRFNREDGKTWYHNSSFVDSKIAGSDGWDRSAQPLYDYFDPRPVSRWREILGKKEQQTINALSGPLMARVGYDTAAVPVSVTVSSRVQWMGWQVRQRVRPYLPPALRPNLRKPLKTAVGEG